jgi:hypothetical protein
MEKNNNEQKKISWGTPMIVFFIVIVILIPMIKKGVHTAGLQNSNSQKPTSLNQVRSQDYYDSVIVAGSDSTKQFFTYHRATIAKFNGTKMIASQDSAMSGYVVLKKNRISMGAIESKKDDYFIEEYKKLSGGKYVFITHDSDNEKCTINILQDKGDDLVVLHYNDLNVMIYLYINKGFTLDLKPYERS